MPRRVGRWRWWILAAVFLWALWPVFTQAVALAETSLDKLNDQNTPFPITNSPLAIINLSDHPDPFSPNGDGLDETTKITSSFNHAITCAKLIIRGPGGGVVYRRIARARITRTTSSLAWKWDGRDSSGVNLPDATYSYTVIGRDARGSRASGLGTVTIRAGGGLSPTDEAALTSALETISTEWVQSAVDTANDILTKSDYTAADWEAYFNTYFTTTHHPFTNGLADYLSYPVFFWFDDAVHLKLQTALANALWNTITTLMKSHASALGPDLAADRLLREHLFNGHQFFITMGMHGVVGDPVRQTIITRYKTLISQYPQYLGAGKINTTLQPYVAPLRAQVWMSFRDSQPTLTAADKLDMAGTLGLGGFRLGIWNCFSLLLHDNKGLDAMQHQVIRRFLKRVPQSLHRLDHMTVADFLWGAESPRIDLIAKRAVNIFGMRVGESSENSFPDDIDPRLVDVFTVVLAHETNHAVDASTIEPNPKLAERKAALLRQAGVVDLQYLRSMIGGAYFQDAPQEFIASIANQWFTDSQHTLDLGVLRFDRGYREPLNQALFFVDLYSLGGPVSRFYQIDTRGNVTVQSIPLIRDGSGRIIGLTSQGRTYSFLLDADGNVTSYTVR
ncbi:MAG: hypothetical protein HYZ89_07305 [Candidatus Omnitrophica bacterium]|nr:hypothetical protein [Candidatus Omnitrophota bacterium]